MNLYGLAVKMATNLLHSITQRKNLQKISYFDLPATGITKNFYHTFAEWLNQQGYNVLSFDFRGIGQSLHGKFKIRMQVLMIGGN